jgi:hypothetical protein
MDIDLPPSEYRSDRKKPREPFFGPGLPDAIGYVIGFAVVVTVLYFLRN